MGNKGIESLFKLEKDPILFTFQLPEIEENEEMIQISANQLERIIGLATIIVAKDCQFQQIILPHEEGKLESVAFLVKGDTDALRITFDELLGDHEDNESNEFSD